MTICAARAHGEDEHDRNSVVGQSSIIHHYNGVQRETTQENAEKLKTDIAEIEQILNDAEEQVPEEISAPPTPSTLP